MRNSGKCPCLAPSMHYLERPSALSRVFTLCLHPVQMVWRKVHSSLTHRMTAWDVQQSLDPSANHATKPMQEVQNSCQIIKTPIYDHASYGTKFMYFIYSKARVEEQNFFMGHLHMMEASTNRARSTPFKGSHLQPNLKEFVQEILRLREHLSLYGGLSMDLKQCTEPKDSCSRDWGLYPRGAWTSWSPQSSTFRPTSPSRSILTPMYEDATDNKMTEDLVPLKVQVIF